jgi:alpha-tubulin suppressor-like RCC1 family protein
VPAGLNNVIAVAAGAAFSLALKADGTVVAWGDNSAGQLNVPGGLAGVMAIDTGDFHCLALKTDGTVVGWGHNIAGQSSVPAGLTGVTDITAGSQFSMARRADGTVVAWGRNNDGQRNVPAGLGYVSAIAAGGNFALALRASSRLRAWGSSSYATAGPVLGAVQIAGGGTHSLVLRGDGELLGWGHGAQDQLASPAGIGPLRSVAAGRAYSLVLKSNGEPVLFGSYDPGISSFVPFGLPGDLTGLRAVAQGFNQALAVRANGTVAAWGRNTEGQCIVPDDLGGVKAVAGGRVHTLALRPDGTVAAWGQSDPIPAGLAGVTAIAVGEYHNLALKSDGTVVAWGRNTNGQCDVPADLTGVRAIAAGYYHSLALKDDGTIIGWGASSYGELTVPTGVTGVTQVAAGAFHSSAIFADPAPTLTAPSTLETVEDTPSAPLEFTLWDRETPLADLTVSASCSVPGLVQALTLTGSGATRTLGVSPSSDQFGTATVTLTVSDGISQTNHQIALTVHPRNDAPSYAKGEDQTVDEDAGSQSVPGWATHLSAGPSNEAGQQLLFNLVANTRPELFISEPAVNPVTGDLTYTPAPNAHGNATIGFQLQDDGGTEHDGQDTEPDVQTFQITVNSVPDAPLARGEEYSLWKNTPLTVAAPGVLGNDVEYEGEALTAVLASGVSHGSLTLNPDGSFTYTPTAGYAGTDSFTYRARDTSGANSSPTTVTLTVQNDTTAPTLVVGSTVSLTGPPRVHVPVTISDGQSGVISVQLTANSSNVLLRDPATGREVSIGGTLTFNPALASVVVHAAKVDVSRSARVELRAVDASGNARVGDPVVANLEVKKRQLDRTYKNLPRHEHYLKLENGTPGLTQVKLWVNGKRVHTGSLVDGAVLQLDLASWMKHPKNIVRVQAEGPAGATVVLLIGDQSLVGGTGASRARLGGSLRREVLRLAP